MATPGRCIADKCRECLCVEARRQGQQYDCLSALCPLYPAMPWRGKNVADTDKARAEALHKERPRRQPSRAIIRRMCAECLEGAECTADCPLREWTQKQPGGAPRKALEGEALERARLNVLQHGFTRRSARESA